MTCQRIDGSASRSQSMTGSPDDRGCTSLCVRVIAAERERGANASVRDG